MRRPDRHRQRRPRLQFNDENLAGATYPAGTVAMANAGPNTNGSQFFFTWKDTKLSPAYTPFGVVMRRHGRAAEDRRRRRGRPELAGDGYPNDYVLFDHVNIRQW